MTLPNDDRPVTVRCPRCGGRAVCEAPFRLHNLPKRAAPKGTVPEKDGRKLIVWGGWWVEEKFPSIITWRPPAPNKATVSGHPV
jgi:hypothetical protein